MLYYYLCAAFTLISSIVSFGFSIDAILKSKKLKDHSYTNAMYAFSRSLSLVLASFIPFFYESHAFLVAVSIVMISVQFIDGIIGMIIKNTFKTIGPLLTAFGNGILLFLLFLN